MRVDFQFLRSQASRVETRAEKIERCQQVVSRLKKSYPNAKLALDFSSPLELLIALILAAQAHDTLVNTITPFLFTKYRTAQDWADAPIATLQNEISKITFFRNKTRSIKAAGKTLVENFGGKVPKKLDDLLTVPGVGRKTANVLLGNAFGQQTIGVDRHVARVSGRLEFTRNTEPDLIEEDLMKVVPATERVNYCLMLQLHGRQICVAKNPRCLECPVNQLCPYPRKNGINLS